MKKKKKPTSCKLSVLAQICKLFPPHLAPKLARKHRVDCKARTFSPWSHVVALIFSQITHAIGLNDVCDGLRHHLGRLWSVRGAVAPSKNALSYANKHRDAAMAEDLFWSMMQHLRGLDQSWISKKLPKGWRHFRRSIHIVDTTTIRLVANCLDWAKHRRRKAAAKCHLRLNLQSFLPNVVIVDTAGNSDNKRARELCSDLKDGEVVIFDMAYIDYEHFYDLDQRGVSWVTRAKENMSYKVVNRRLDQPAGRIISDDEVVFDKPLANKAYPNRLRRVEAWIEVDGKYRSMIFITNNLKWSAQSVCQLYKSRWKIEVFFKQIKQTLQLCDFIGHSANAVRWQVWVALLVYVLMRFLAHQSRWNHSFTRLFTLIRGVIWDKYELYALLERYGTAQSQYRMLAAPQQAYLPGFERIP